MSNSSTSPQPLLLEHTHESGVLRHDSPSTDQETLIYSGPPSLPKSNPLAQAPPDVGDNCPNEDEGEGVGVGKVDAQVQEISAISSVPALRVDPTPTAAHASSGDVTAASPFGDTITRWGSRKRKKGRGKGKPNLTKVRAMDEKLQALSDKLIPIPFIPNKIPDIPKYEKLLRKLDLWDFVHIDLDRKINVHYIAQLIATYQPKLRASYVGGVRIQVSRASLARAFQLPVKKKRNTGGGDVGVEHEPLSDESIVFVSMLVSNWFLLHDDTWLMPDEVAELFLLIKAGHPEKVDWGSMLWFMVEKELKRGRHLRGCYYASHLQHLIKCQCEHLFSAVQSTYKHSEEDEIGAIAGEDIDVNIPIEKVNNLEEKGSLVEGPSTELRLGHDGVKEEGAKDGETMNTVEKCKDNGGGEMVEDIADGQEQSLSKEKRNFEEIFVRRCSTVSVEAFQKFDENKVEEDKEMEEIEDEQEKNDLGEFFTKTHIWVNPEPFQRLEESKYEVEEDNDEEVDGDGHKDVNEFGVFPRHEDSLDGEGFTGNLIQAMEDNRMAFNPQDEPHEQCSIDPRVGDMLPSINNWGKRVLEHNSSHLMDHPNEGNKKSRFTDSWGHDNKHMGFGMCMEQIQHFAETAMILYKEKDSALDQLNVNQQILHAEMQKRDLIIEHLHQTRYEEVQKKNAEIYRMERELALLGTMVEGYKKALKETQRVFADYREKAQLPEEPIYKDFGSGGLMLTADGIEKLRKKQEEEFRMNCSIVEQKMKEFEEDCDRRFSYFAETVTLYNKKLMGLETSAKQVIELYRNRKTKQIAEMGGEEASESETEEPPSPLQPEPEAEEHQLTLQSKAKECDGAEDSLPSE